MQWFIFVLLGAVVQSFTEIIRKVVLSGKYKVDYYTTAFLLSVVTALVLGVYVMITGFQMPPIASFAWIFVLNIMLGVVGLLTSQRGLSHLGVGDFTVLITLRQVITWLLSIALLGVGLTLRQGIGSLLIIGAILLIFLGKRAFRHVSGAGIGFTLLTALNHGFAVLTDQVVYRYSDPASFLFVGFTLTAIILLILKPYVVNSVKLLKPSPNSCKPCCVGFSNFTELTTYGFNSVKLLKPTQQGLQLFGLGVGNGLGLVLLFTGLKQVDNAPLFSGLSQISIVLSVVLGMLLLGERKNVARKLIGATLAAAGAFLMVL